MELATKLGRKLGRKGRADILLIDKNLTHIWKPLLHEVAAGTLDAELDAVSYRSHAHNNGFRFAVGCLYGIDRQKKAILLEPVADEDGEQILPERQEHYDLLVLAIGSVSNDFSIEGIKQNCIYLDTPSQAKRFHRKLLNHTIRLNGDLETDPSKVLSIAIVGGGATGVELAAELYNAREWFQLYGLSRVTKNHLKVSLVEAGPRLLAGLDERIAKGATRQLQRLGVAVHTNTQVARAEPGRLRTKDGSQITAELMVWAAGVKAPEFLRNLGLECNRLNQIVVNPFLQAKEDPSIFALGDCAGFALDDKRWVPPRAQSAHQMAEVVYRNLVHTVAGKPLKPFKYVDHGSLVSLSRYTAYGRLMGNLTHGAINLDGRLARAAYISLYRMHQVALHGWLKTAVIMASARVQRVLRPRLKMH